MQLAHFYKEGIYCSSLPILFFFQQFLTWWNARCGGILPSNSSPGRLCVAIVHFSSGCRRFAHCVESNPLRNITQNSRPVGILCTWEYQRSLGKTGKIVSVERPTSAMSSTLITSLRTLRHRKKCLKWPPKKSYKVVQFTLE